MKQGKKRKSPELLHQNTRRRGNRDRTRKTIDKKFGKIYKFTNSKISNTKQDDIEGNQPRPTIIGRLKTKDKKKRT